MDKKPTPIYLFVVLVSLLIFGISMSVVLINSSIVITIFVLILLIFGAVTIFIYIANALNTDGFKTKMEHKQVCPSCHKLISSHINFCPECGTSIEEKNECEYCAHLNPFDSESCQKCGASLI